MENPLQVARLTFTGSAIVLVMYGIFFTLSAICLHYLLSKRSGNWIVLGYTVTSLLVTTIFLVASTEFTELILIESNVNPAAALLLISKLNLLQQVIYSIKIWLADSLLIYRLWVIWGGNSTIIIFPCVLFVGVFATGIAGVALFPHEAEKHATVVNLGVGFHACSVALNLLATVLIAGRLLCRRNTIRQLGGDNGHHYVSLMAVFAESGALYSVTALVYIPLYATSSPYMYVFAALLEAAAGIAPALILLRMALGVAIERRNQTPTLTTLHFKPGKQSRTADTSETLSTFTAPSHTAFSSSHHTSTGSYGDKDQNNLLDEDNIAVLPKARARQNDIEMNSLG